MVSLIEIFGDSAQVKVLDFLLQNLGDMMMMISDVAKGAGVANSTSARVIEPLLSSGIAKEIKIGKQIRIIKLNKEDEKARLLIRLMDGLKNLEAKKESAERDLATRTEKEPKAIRRK